MGVKATIEGEFLDAELRPWEFEGRTGKTWSVSILQESDSVRISAKEDVLSTQTMPARGTKVTCEVDLVKDQASGRYKIQVVNMVETGKAKLAAAN